MNETWVAEDVVVYSGFLGSEECDVLVAKALSSRSIKPEESGGGTPFEIVNDFVDIPEVHGVIARIHPFVIEAFPEFEIQDVAYIQNSMLKYQYPGQSHNLHTDANVGDGVKSVGRTTIDEDAKLPSLVSTIIVLNDDYEGGEFIIPDYGVNFKLGKGDLIAWPSAGHLHGVKVVTGQAPRYSFVSWWYQKGACSSVVRAGDS